MLSLEDRTIKSQCIVIAHNYHNVVYGLSQICFNTIGILSRWLPWLHIVIQKNLFLWYCMYIFTLKLENLHSCLVSKVV